MRLVRRAALKLMPSGFYIRPALKNVAFHLPEAVDKLVDLDIRPGRMDHGEKDIDGQIIAHAGVDLDDFVPANCDRFAMVREDEAVRQKVERTGKPTAI